MKKNKIISIVLTLVLCIGCLTGCMGNVGTVTINADGSGVAVIKTGFT